MRTIILFILFTISFPSILLSDYYGKPYFTKLKRNPFERFYMDSSNICYIAGHTPLHSYKDLSDTLVRHTHFALKDTTCESYLYNPIGYSNKSHMAIVAPKIIGYYGQDSLKPYLLFKNQDTTLSWLYREGELHPHYKYIIDAEYSDGKYWFFGNIKFLLSFDENTLEIDSIPIDGTIVKTYHTFGSAINSYQNGLLYFTQNRKELHFFSKDTSYTINADSIFKVASPKYSDLYNVELRDDKLYILDTRVHVVIFDLKTYETEFIDLTKGIVGKHLEEDLAKDKKIPGYIHIGSNHDIYLSYYSFGKSAPAVFRVDKDRICKELKSELLFESRSVISTPFDYVWLYGPYKNPNSDTNWVAIPYFPEGNSVESVPSMITLRTYPNPTKTQTKVQFYIRPDLIDDLEFTIYDYMGNQVDKLDKEVEYDNSRFYATKTIQSSKYRTGIYYLHINNGVESKMFGFAVE